MKKLILTAPLLLLFAAACSKKAEPIKVTEIKAGEYEPKEWAKNYPLEHEGWEATANPTPAGKSFYKKGWDTDGKIYDKLSEFPYMPLLFSGWGFGIEYNEPRGHMHMLTDVLEVDPARRKAGGVCLTCKTPYAQELQEKHGRDYFSKPFDEIHALIPKNHRELGAACITCHEPADMALKLKNDFTLGKALRDMGVDTAKLSNQEMRSLVCAQCHVTYVIPKDKQMHSTGVFFPWQNSKYGNISIEAIIRKIKSDPAHLEWTQAVTGFKLGFLRHPEFELFSNASTHWKAGLACADCHMPYTRAGSKKISDHRVMSPLKKDMKACIQCHSQGKDWLLERVRAIQDRTASLQLRAGYATAAAAKLFERANKASKDGRKVDQALYARAKEYYEEAFYRVTFIGAENSMGFHNPPETLRVLGDAAYFAGKAEGLLRQALAQAGAPAPARLDLELGKYLENRGKKKLNFDRTVEVKDPFKVQENF
ncbi:MAG: cytochrome C nitrite reductase [Elusimicrobia bacterium GWA2_61_42]|nr:MAG: cytochrome C nitrite reductase [Elusimicrobia bacterium GWA2_61_42]OGR75305.1 MAG: cytochrome C nitrite reductase [Elusimicrobia bacterium GWC2_61_25]